MKKTFTLLLFLSFCIAQAQDRTESYLKAESISQRLSKAFAAQNFDEIKLLFSEPLFDKLGDDQLENKMKPFFNSEGEVKNILQFAERVTAEATLYHQGLEFEQNKYDLIFTLDENELLTSFRIGPYTNKDEWVVPDYVSLKKIESKAIKIGDEFPLLGELVNTSQGNLNTVVIMVHGSGANDMDESLGPNKLFKDIAYGLATYNIASIRYNKRSYDYPSRSAKMMNEMGIDDIVTNDAVLAVKKARELGAKKVILLGHSLGGHLSPKIASKVQVEGVIIMAGNASGLEDLILPQYEHIRKNDTSSTITDFQFNFIKKQVENLKEKNYNEKTVGPKLPFGLPGKFWMSLQGYNPVKMAKKQKQPYLILNGERDYQVTVEEAEKWKSGNKNKQSKTIIYPKLNHMFYAGEGILIPGEYEKQGSLNEEVLTNMINWIKAL